MRVVRSEKVLGFTLIELLVVIAIIGILAAMLFPVFARARESARKIQCLSNVKNIAMALQMYLTDWDAFFPYEHDATAKAYFDAAPGGGTPTQDCTVAFRANPYLRHPAILDEYIKNRDVWRCPSAKIEATPNWITPVGRYGYWLNNYLDNEGTWGRAAGVGPCDRTYPPGWGGTVTDSFVQGSNQGRVGATSKSDRAFTQSLATFNSYDYCEMKTSEIGDPSWFVVVGDGGALTKMEFWVANTLAFPDTCAATYCGAVGGCTFADAGCWPSTTRDYVIGMDIINQFWGDGSVRGRYARHLGGVNIGFADGHAKWFRSDAVLEAVNTGQMQGLCGACSPSTQF